MKTLTLVVGHGFARVRVWVRKKYPRVTHGEHYKKEKDL
jgi:hypothetical protein